MRNRNNIFITGIFALLFAFSACSKETQVEPAPPVEASALMSVVVDNEQPSNTAYDDYREVIRTVRLFVFNNASTTPKLDVNSYTVVSATEGTKITVDLKVTTNNDKMIVAVINEPTSLNSSLATISHPSQLEMMRYNFADVVNANHTALTIAGLPMTGVKRGIAVTEAHTQTSPQLIEMAVDRALARVDIYLNKNMTQVAQLTTSTAIRLKNTYNQGFLVTGTEKDKTRYQVGALASQNFGQMLTVGSSEFIAVPWSPSASVTLGTATPTVPVCSFYTPERSCIAGSDADKLKLEFSNIQIAGIGPRNAEITLSDMTTLPAGETDPNLKEIRRNNVYEIYGTVTSMSMNFQAQVLPWEDATLYGAFNNSYYLDVSKYESVIDPLIGTDKLIIKTDDPGGWSAALYNDMNNIPISPSTWMTLSTLSGAMSTTGTELIVTLGSGANAGESRYIKFASGQKTVWVKITKQ